MDWTDIHDAQEEAWLEYGGHEDDIQWEPVYEPKNFLVRSLEADLKDEQYREDNELHHDLMQHRKDCPQTHTYLAGDKMKPACTECMLTINRLYGTRPYHTVSKEAA